MVATQRDAPWTYDDLLALPDDGKRYEIIEGTLYEMTGTSWEHGTVVANLIGLLLPIVRSLGAVWRTAPIDVFFPGATPVQPDIFVVMPGSMAKPSPRGIEGAPDLVIEALSPSNRAHDVSTKRLLYERGGVREYWLVDPVERTVEILSLAGDRFVSVGIGAHFDDVVSPLLAGSVLHVADIFAGLDEAAPIG